MQTIQLSTLSTLENNYMSGSYIHYFFQRQPSFVHQELARAELITLALIPSEQSVQL